MSVYIATLLENGQETRITVSEKELEKHRLPGESEAEVRERILCYLKQRHRGIYFVDKNDKQS